MGDFLSQCEKQHFKSKNYYDYIQAAFEMNLATFYVNIWSHCSVNDKNVQAKFGFKLKSSASKPSKPIMTSAAALSS